MDSALLFSALKPGLVPAFCHLSTWLLASYALDPIPAMEGSERECRFLAGILYSTQKIVPSPSPWPLMVLLHVSCCCTQGCDLL